MALVHWATPTTWADAIAASLLSATAINAGVLSGTVISNGTAKDIYADISIRLASLTPAAGGHIAMYFLPLLDDGTTYADGTTSGTATAQPTITHFVGALALRAVAGAQNGMIRGIVIPPGDGKFYLINRAGVALATTTTANLVKWRGYTEEVS